MLHYTAERTIDITPASPPDTNHPSTTNPDQYQSDDHTIQLYDATAKLPRGITRLLTAVSSLY